MLGSFMLPSIHRMRTVTTNSSLIAIVAAITSIRNWFTFHPIRGAFQILFTVAPQDMQLRASPSERVQEGDSVTIYCTCGNYPKTWIILKKKAETGDTVLKSVEGAYIIHKAQLEDAGVYECESKNELGWQFRSLTLDVKG